MKHHITQSYNRALLAILSMLAIFAPSMAKADTLLETLQSNTQTFITAAVAVVSAVLIAAFVIPVARAGYRLACRLLGAVK